MHDDLEVPEPVEVSPRTFPVLSTMVRWLKIGAVAFLLLIAALGIGVGIVVRGFNDQHDADQKAAVEQREHDQAATLQRRIDACERDNRARDGQRQLAATSAASNTAFAALLINGVAITPELQARIDAFQAAVVQPFLDLADPTTGKFAARDCSPESVNNGG